MIAYFVSFLYIFTAIGQFLLVKWNDDHLPFIDGGTNSTQTADLGYPFSSNMAVIAAARAGIDTMPGLLTGCYIFSVLSASNSALYVASRTLYGLTRDLDKTNVATRFLRKFSKVAPQTGVPAIALLVSFLAFIWLPFLRLKHSYPVSEVSNTSSDSNSIPNAYHQLLVILQTTGSVSCLIVWASLCLAFIRYERW